MKSGYEKLVNAMRSNPDVMKFIAKWHRQRELRQYSERIAALERAKETLAKSPLRAVRPGKYTAEKLARTLTWEDEEAAECLEAFWGHQKDQQFVAVRDGMRKVGGAMLF